MSVATCTQAPRNPSYPEQHVPEAVPSSSRGAHTDPEAQSALELQAGRTVVPKQPTALNGYVKAFCPDVIRRKQMPPSSVVE
jgi:hypothetical protein